MRSPLRRSVGVAVAVVVVGVCAVGAFALVWDRDVQKREVIAYWSPGEMSVYTIRPDGSDKRQLVTGAAPALSRDGRKVAFVDDAGYVEIAAIDGTPQAKLECGQGLPGDVLDWSPSGREIVCANSWKAGPGEEWHNELSIVDVRSRHSRRLVSAGWAPQWSPDGTWIAYDDNSEIRVIDLQTHKIQRLGPGSAPSWSPDASQLAYVTRHTLGVMNANGSGRHPILRSADDNAFDDPTWSPDGSRIAFTSAGQKAIHVVNTDGSDEKVLVRYAVNPDWGAGQLVARIRSGLVDVSDV